MPLFRSPEQLALLAELMFGPGEERELADVYRRAGVSQSTAAREVARLEEAGIVMSRMVGRSKIVTVDESLPYLADLRRILAATAGPLAIAREIYGRVSSVEQAYVFGSWAQRYHGAAGPRPRDLDVVVVSTASSQLDDELTAARMELERRTGLPVDQFVVRPGSNWLAGTDEVTVPVFAEVA
jgi:DNA-binding transcriptional ArsR family regulator